MAIMGAMAGINSTRRQAVGAGRGQSSFLSFEKPGRSAFREAAKSRRRVTRLDLRGRTASPGFLGAEVEFAGGEESDAGEGLAGCWFGAGGEGFPRVGRPGNSVLAHRRFEG